MKYDLVYKSRITPFFPGCFNLSNYNFKEILGLDSKQNDYVLTIIYNKTTYWLFPKSLKKEGIRALDLFFKNKKSIIKIKHREHIISQRILQEIKFPINKLFKNNVLSEEGEIKFKNILKLYQEYTYLVDTLGFLFQVYYVEKFRRLFFRDLGDISLSKKENIFNFVLSSSKKTNYEIFLSYLCRYINNGEKNKDLDLIVGKFYWLVHDYLGEVIDEKYIKKTVVKIKKESLDKFRKEIQEADARVKRIKQINKNLNKKAVLKANLWQELSYLYNERKKEVLNRVNIYLRQMAEYKLATKNIDQIHLFFQLAPQEIIESYKKHKIKLDNQRNRAWVYKMRNKIIENGDLKYLKIATNFDETKIIKGTPASLGKIKGRASIILNISHIPKFKSGNILIAPYTNVNYLPIMRRASAILTETGGLTSHAAIIARELKIPCIVSVRNLLSVLKDGDLIEVDANKGIVRKL